MKAGTPTGRRRWRSRFRRLAELGRRFLRISTMDWAIRFFRGGTWYEQSRPIAGDDSAENLTAIVDLREQLPLDLSPLRTIRGTLATGDYSVQGLENIVAIERKSLGGPRSRRMAKWRSDQVTPSRGDWQFARLGGGGCADHHWPATTKGLAVLSVGCSTRRRGGGGRECRSLFDGVSLQNNSGEPDLAVAF